MLAAQQLNIQKLINQEVVIIVYMEMSHQGKFLRRYLGAHILCYLVCLHHALDNICKYKPFVLAPKRKI